MNHSFLQKFISTSSKTFPHFSDALALIPENFVSEEMISLDPTDFSMIKDCVETLYSHISAPRPFSVVTGFDFYITDDGPKLLEINTNAAAAPIVYLLQRFHNPDFHPHYFDTMRRHFESELLATGRSLSSVKVAIIDEAVATQKTYFEFLLYQSLFRSWGWECDIRDSLDFSYEGYDLVYYRSCDFLLSKAKADAEKNVCLTPTPHAYRTLSDKRRLIDFAKLSSCVPESMLVTEANHLDLWQRRRQLFFKPVDSYGSKGVYKGASITKTVFASFLSHPTIAQTYVVPHTHSITTDSGIEAFKYDIRVYTYEGEIQLLGARLFQGQVTNFKSAYGGFAAVKHV